MNKKIPNFITKKWKLKSGEVKCCYYHRGARPARKETPLGSDYKKAIKKWAEIEGVRYEQPNSGTVAEIYSKYIKWAKNPKLSDLSAKTIKGYESFWGQPKIGEKPPGRLYCAFGHHGINNLKSGWMFQYFEARSSQIRAKKELKFLQTLCNWARARELMTAANPLAGILRQMKVNEKREIYVEDSWYDLVYKHGTCDVKGAMTVCYLASNRPAEATAAMFKHIDGNDLVVPLEKTRKKGIREKRVLIQDKLAEYIKQQQSKTPRSFYLVSDKNGQRVDTDSSTFRRRFKKARDMAEAEAKENGVSFQRFQLKDLRAKAATDIAREYGLEAARLALGHTTQKQTSEYVRSIVGAADKAFKMG